MDITPGIKPRVKNISKNPSKKIYSQDPSSQHQNGGAGSHAGTDSESLTYGSVRA